jgi:hypothetical protein
VAWTGSIPTRVAGVLAVGALGLIAPLLAGDDEMPTATPNKPAVITVTLPPGPERTQAGSSVYVELSVLSFRPPVKGSIQAVVKLYEGSISVAQEVGRFGLFPNTEFKARNPSQAQRFIFQLPGEKLPTRAGAGLKLSIELVPYGSTGEGARLELGGAEIQRR